MAFPITLSEVRDNETDIMAAHINSLEEKVGVDGSSDEDSLDFKVAQMDTKDAAILAAANAYTDDEIAAIPIPDLSFLYPVGTVYANRTNSTNPATLFGFGTWVAIEGEVVVGKAPSGTFATAGALVGAETVALSIANLAVHNHGDDHQHSGQSGGISANHQHAHDPGMRGNYSGGSNIKAGGSTYWCQNEADRGYAVNTGYVTSDHSHFTTTNYKSTQGFGTTTANAGSGTAHNNIQPSRVCYVWYRTA